MIFYVISSKNIWQTARYTILGSFWGELQGLSCEAFRKMSLIESHLRKGNTGSKHGSQCRFFRGLSANKADSLVKVPYTTSKGGIQKARES